MDKLHKGTPATREFYDRLGWQRQEGTLVDTLMFGWTDGPIRRALDDQRNERLVQAAGGGASVKLADLGCGGSPAVFLAKRCSSYTAVDFSSTGLLEAAEALKAANVPFQTIEADITDLPFEDGAFDIVYSANALYHIDSVDGQATAFQEAMRIVRPGGRAIFVLANPFPLLFPYRLVRRVLAMTPGIATVLNTLRAEPPLPYLPMPLGWTKRQLAKWGEVRVTGHAVPSIEFDRRISETTSVGHLVWRTIQHLETHHSALAARLGCYVLIIVDKSNSQQARRPVAADAR